MRKIDKSHNTPQTLIGAPVPTNSDQVNSAIYKADDVRSQLLTDQHNKCCYCECRVTMQYNDVEHYRYKNHYYWLGHDWNNLLFSCDLCNRSYKKEQFPLAQGSIQANNPTDDLSLEHPLIINPSITDPTNHIRFRRHEAIHLTPEGEETIKIFDLNNKRGGREIMIEDRKRLFEKYELLGKNIQLAKNLLSSSDFPDESKATAQELLDSCNKSLQSLIAPEEPYSGMLIAQI